jgi:ribonuclease P protein component
MKATKEQMESLGRLQRRSDFLRVQQSGRKWVSQSLILQVAENTGGKARFGLTVTKKVSGSAVVRNRIRRRLRALACQVLALQAKPGMDYVLVGRVETESRDFAMLEKDLLWCLKRLDLLAGEKETG